MLVRVADAADESLVRELTRWHAYTRRRGLVSDFVVLDERDGVHAKAFKEKLQAGSSGDLLGKPGGLFVVSRANVSADDATLITAAARVVLGGGRGSLADQLVGQSDATSYPPTLVTTRAIKADAAAPPAARTSGLIFWNGFGGFSPDGREYVIVVDCTTAAAPALPPAPWTNVIANPNFGCLVTEAGLGYSWAGNSQMNRLTPWSNDPVSDSPGEVIYLRDEESGEVWTPTPLPRGPQSVVTVQHGQGYTRYSNESRGLQQKLLVFVPTEDPIKVICASSCKARTTDLDDFRPIMPRWVLGPSARTLLQCKSFASAMVNPACFGAQCLDGPLPAARVRGRRSQDPILTTDRTNSFGSHGACRLPQHWRGWTLPLDSGPALDPCSIDDRHPPGARRDTRVIFVIGEADNLEQVRSLVQYLHGFGSGRTPLAEWVVTGTESSKAIQMVTPDIGLNLMLNRWLLYQVLACHIWARSAFYQSGGAYGFRDQLQDVMALVYSDPTEARAHLLRSAARQFEEGDVQHWWHPPSGVGVRTRITDDLYFLPLAVHHYVIKTGDVKLLDEKMPYIHSPVLRDNEEETFNLPIVSEQIGTIYEHCVRALEKGYRLGEHGLPLMGTGDWNDGMNKGGGEGKGESVWNGWFFVSVLNTFAESRRDAATTSSAAWCEKRAEALRRPGRQCMGRLLVSPRYFDDGTPLGSAQNDSAKSTRSRRPGP